MSRAMWMRCGALAAIVVVGPPAAVAAPAAAQRSPRQEPAEVACPAELGPGVESGRVYCDVRTGLDPAAGIVVRVPRHRGSAVLAFDLHNRHTYSESAVEAGRGFARYTATVGVLTMENTLVRRATIASEFRTASDLVERVGGGAGPEGVKAVAPTGAESIYVELPAGVSEVSILGEVLEVQRREGREQYSAPGRPIALISNVMVEYRPR